MRAAIGCVCSSVLVKSCDDITLDLARAVRTANQTLVWNLSGGIARIGVDSLVRLRWFKLEHVTELYALTKKHHAWPVWMMAT